MPELPETETIARDLHGLIAGAPISGVEVIRADVLRGPLSGAFAEHQLSRSIDSVLRRAKSVVLRLDDGKALVVTPRFTGSLQVDVQPDGYATIIWHLKDGRHLLYRDVRRLGTVTLFDAAGYQAFDRALGVEPLTEGFTSEALSGILRGSETPIKKALMDQRRVAGIGNIYANEALWGAGIDPSREAGSLSSDECEDLVRVLRAVLEASIEARGTTFRDYRDAYNNRGGFAEQLQAYGRGGQPCPRCATRLTETHAIDGRSTVFCHRCQS